MKSYKAKVYAFQRILADEERKSRGEKTDAEKIIADIMREVLPKNHPKR